MLTSRWEKNECVLIFDDKAVNNLLLRQSEIVKAEGFFQDLISLLHCGVGTGTAALIAQGRGGVRMRVLYCNLARVVYASRRVVWPGAIVADSSRADGTVKQLKVRY